MTLPTNQELVDHWRDEPAPLLPLLHAFHDRDGFLSEEAMRELEKDTVIKDALGSEIYEVFAITKLNKLFNIDN